MSPPTSVARAAVGVVVHGVEVADGPRERHHVARLDGEPLGGHGRSSGSAPGDLAGHYGVARCARNEVEHDRAELLWVPARPVVDDGARVPALRDADADRPRR